MILISDCSALIALSTCQQLNLLDELFCEVIVPEAVYYEATQPNKKQAKQLKAYLEDKVRRVDMQNYVFLDGIPEQVKSFQCRKDMVSISSPGVI
jgi:predicted nucleic acid-binding protein